MPTLVVGPEGSRMWTCRKPALGRSHNTTSRMDILFSQHCVPSSTYCNISERFRPPRSSSFISLISSHMADFKLSHCPIVTSLESGGESVFPCVVFGRLLQVERLLEMFFL